MFNTILSISILTALSSFAQYTGIGKDDPKVAARVQEFAPSPIDSKLSRKVQNYQDLRSPGLGMLHPDKKRLFFSWRVTGTTQVWMVKRPQSFPVQYTGGEANTLLQDITPDGKFLILSRDFDGEENPGIYLQSVDGGELTTIQHTSKVQTFYEFSSSDSQWVYFRANDLKSDSYAIYKYNLKTKEKQLIFSEDGRWNVSDHWKEEKLLLSKAVTSVASEYFELDLATKKLEPLYGQGLKDEAYISYLDGKDQFLVLTNEFSDFKELYSWNRKTKKFKAIRKGQKYDITGMNMNEARTRLAIDSNQNAYSKMEVVRLPDFKKIEVATFKNADHVYSGSWTRNGSHLMIGVETAQSPRVSYSYQFENKILTQWVLPSSPEVDTKVFIRAQEIWIPTRDSAKIPAFVRVPKQCEKQFKGDFSEGKCPVIVHFHGGPEGQSRPGFNIWAQLFVEEGFIYVDPNVRGSEGYGKTYLESDNGPKRLQVVTDIEDIAKYIRAQWGNPKVGVYGGSYGGYSTFYAMTRFSGNYDAGVAIVGMSDLISFLNNTAPYRRALRMSEYGNPDTDSEALKELSAINHLDKLKGPLMIIQGLNDPRVPAGEAIQIYDKLQAKKIPASLILFPDEGHGTQKRANKVLELGHTLQFLRAHLL
jgi:dipeptidyl aminopeptidase/acylaminoacyl peptidase